jgi:hypothetical protein
MVVFVLHSKHTCWEFILPWQAGFYIYKEDEYFGEIIDKMFCISNLMNCFFYVINNSFQAAYVKVLSSTTQTQCVYCFREQLKCFHYVLKPNIPF